MASFRTLVQAPGSLTESRCKGRGCDSSAPPCTCSLCSWCWGSLSAAGNKCQALGWGSCPTAHAKGHGRAGRDTAPAPGGLTLFLALQPAAHHLATSCLGFSNFKRHLTLPLLREGLGSTAPQYVCKYVKVSGLGRGTESNPRFQAGTIDGFMSCSTNTVRPSVWPLANKTNYGRIKNKLGDRGLGGLNDHTEAFL